MRALLLCTDIYGGHGGIALFNRELVATLSTYPRFDEIVVMPRLVVRDELEPIPANVRFVADAARGRVAFMSALRRLRSEPFDLVICGHVNLLPIARLVTKSPLLVTHGIEAWKPLRDPFSNALLEHCSGIVSVSDVTRQRLLRWSAYPGRTYVLPNAIRAEKYGLRPRSEALSARYGLGGKRVLLTVGRIAAEERYKGFDEMIELMPELLRAAPDVAYVIAGSGNDLERLRRKASQLDVGEHVVFTNYFNEAEKPDLYSLADVYVMPSRGEGFGFVFLEALASGVPTIGSKHDGGREALLHGELGLLVDPSSPAEIRAAVLELLARGGTRAIPERLGFFSFANFERRVHAILDDQLVRNG